MLESDSSSQTEKKRRRAESPGHIASGSHAQTTAQGSTTRGNTHTAQASAHHAAQDPAQHPGSTETAEGTSVESSESLFSSQESEFPDSQSEAAELELVLPETADVASERGRGAQGEHAEAEATPGGGGIRPTGETLRGPGVTQEEQEHERAKTRAQRGVTSSEARTQPEEPEPEDGGTGVRFEPRDEKRTEPGGEEPGPGNMESEPARAEPDDLEPDAKQPEIEPDVVGTDRDPLPDSLELPVYMDLRTSGSRGSRESSTSRSPCLFSQESSSDEAEGGSQNSGNGTWSPPSLFSQPTQEEKLDARVSNDTRVTEVESEATSAPDRNESQSQLEDPRDGIPSGQSAGEMLRKPRFRFRKDSDCPTSVVADNCCLVTTAAVAGADESSTSRHAHISKEIPPNPSPSKPPTSSPTLTVSQRSLASTGNYRRDGNVLLTAHEKASPTAQHRPSPTAQHRSSPTAPQRASPIPPMSPPATPPLSRSPSPAGTPGVSFFDRKLRDFRSFVREKAEDGKHVELDEFGRIRYISQESFNTRVLSTIVSTHGTLGTSAGGGERTTTMGRKRGSEERTGEPGLHNSQEPGTSGVNQVHAGTSSEAAGEERPPADSEDYIRCEDCGLPVPVWEFPEHEDFHFAQRLQKQQQQEELQQHRLQQQATRAAESHAAAAAAAASRGRGTRGRGGRGRRSRGSAPPAPPPPNKKTMLDRFVSRR